MASHVDTSRTPIRVGVAGWDYADWRGRVHPERPARRFDSLAWIAEYVDVVEINTTFYRPIAPSRAESWLRRTAHRSAFRFTAKAHRSWTHEPGAELDDAVSRTLSGLEPIHRAGRLSAVLVQFPQRVHADRVAFERIERILERSEGWPIVVEVRHRSWAERGALEHLDDLGAGWCVVDQPRVAGAVGALERVTGDVAYVRLHGRNRENWFRDGAGRDERYDYRYSGAELDRSAALAARLARHADQVVVVYNNHFQGQAVANALQLKHRIDGRRPRAPAELLRAYPDLSAECVADQESLF